MAKPRGTVPATMKGQLKANLTLIGVLLAVMWGIEIIDTVIGQRIEHYGIRPRELDGLVGLVTSPFIHGSFGHLIANSLPFAVLGFFVLLRGRATFFKASLVIALVGGLGVWLVAGSQTNHIGASGVIFGYFGFLLAIGIFDHSFNSIAVAVLVGILYGGIIFGVLPGQQGISWQGHLFGFLSGGGYGYLSSKRAHAATAKRAA